MGGEYTINIQLISILAPVRRRRRRFRNRFRSFSISILAPVRRRRRRRIRNLVRWRISILAPVRRRPRLRSSCRAAPLFQFSPP